MGINVGIVPRDNPQPDNRLMALGQNDEIVETYRSFFDQGNGIRGLNGVPNELKNLFSFLNLVKVFHNKRNRHFRNGAGKTFLSKLLELHKQYDNELSWLVQISTTGNPEDDWCGYPRRGEPNVSGKLIYTVDIGEVGQSGIHMTNISWYYTITLSK